MAKGAPPPFLRGKGAAAAPPARGSMGRPPPAPPRRAPPPMAPPAGPPPMDPTMAGAPAFNKGGKVGGSFPKGKQAKMPR